MGDRKKVTLTRRRVNEMYAACRDLERRNEPVSQRFSYAVTFNMDVIELIVKAFEKSAKSDVKYKAYDDARIELAKEFAMKDADGNPVDRNGQYVMLDQSAFDKELKTLREEHPAYQERQDYLEETVDVEFHTVKMGHVPKVIGMAYMKMFLCFIEYEDEEFECPACGVELCMEDNQLKELYEIEEEPEPKEEPMPKRKSVNRKKAPPAKRRRRKTK